MPLHIRFAYLGFSLVLVATTVVAACAPDGGGTGQNVGSAGTAVHRIGFYTFDGSNTNAADKSVVHQTFQRAKLRQKAYFAGPDVGGSNLRPIIEAGKARICNDWRAGKVDAISLSGYSRGAIIALAIAHELLLVPAQGQREGCDNVSRTASTGPSPVIPRSVFSIHSYIGRGDKPVIARLALLDAVNTFSYDIGKDTFLSIARLSPQTRCSHFTKNRTAEHLLTTLAVTGCVSELGPAGVGHIALAQNTQARDALERSLTEPGLAFAAEPDLSGLPIDDYRALCPLVTDSTPGAGDGYGRCVKALCTWQRRPTQGVCIAPDVIRVRAPPVQ